MLELLVIAVILGCITGAIAQSKGHSFGGWWLFGAALFIVALPCALMLKPTTEGRDRAEADAVAQGAMKKCPACAELIKREAVKCRYCGTAVAA